jgi:hypothetical protein
MRLLSCLVVVHLIDVPVLIVSRGINKVAEFDNRWTALRQPLMRALIWQALGCLTRYGGRSGLFTNLLHLPIGVQFNFN